MEYSLFYVFKLSIIPFITFLVLFVLKVCLRDRISSGVTLLPLLVWIVDALSDYIGCVCYAGDILVNYNAMYREHLQVARICVIYVIILTILDMILFCIKKRKRVGPETGRSA